jgi:hypothetical protein
VLAMLRLSNECEEVPGEVIERVKKAAETAGKFLRRVWWFSAVANALLTCHSAEIRPVPLLRGKQGFPAEGCIHGEVPFG